MLMGAMMGLIHKTFKEVIKSEHPQNDLERNFIKLKSMSWVMFVTILIAVLIMTNPYLLKI